jgi:hypothetical protein
MELQLGLAARLVVRPLGTPTIFHCSLGSDCLAARTHSEAPAGPGTPACFRREPAREGNAGTEADRAGKPTPIPRASAGKAGHADFGRVLRGGRTAATELQVPSKPQPDSAPGQTHGAPNVKNKR